MAIYLKKFENHTQYENYINGSGAILPNVSICTTEGDVHYNPYDPYGGHDYVEIGGIKWATMNIGASSVTDYGLYFQWGDTQGYTAEQVGVDKIFTMDSYKYSKNGTSTMTKYNLSDHKIVLETSDDAVTTAWGDNWRMPTKTELQSLLTATTSAWTSSYEGSGVSGITFTDASDSSKVLFFPAAGRCGMNGLGYVGTEGNYWLSTIRNSDVSMAYILYFNENSIGDDSAASRCMGYTIRGVFDA